MVGVRGKALRVKGQVGYKNRDGSEINLGTVPYLPIYPSSAGINGASSLRSPSFAIALLFLI